jgi:hypothetical protein
MSRLDQEKMRASHVGLEDDYSGSTLLKPKVKALLKN